MNSLNEIIMLVGLPASGKSTLAEEFEQQGYIVHASDKLRKELYGDINIQNKNNEVFTELHRRIVVDLKSNKNVVFDATNIRYKKRIEFLEKIKHIECQKSCVIVATPYEQCLKNNSERERQVPEEVIRSMYTNFNIPQFYEGWDNIKIYFNYKQKDFNLFDLFNGVNGLNMLKHDNPHHVLTVGEHCIFVYKYLKKIGAERNLQIAGLMHDIGKRFTKEFKDSKGNPTNIAHFYNHANVSAYDSMFYLHQSFIDMGTTDILEILNLIQHHMRLYQSMTNKTINKFTKLVGEDTLQKLLILNEADKIRS